MRMRTRMRVDPNIDHIGDTCRIPSFLILTPRRIKKTPVKAGLLAHESSQLYAFPAKNQPVAHIESFINYSGGTASEYNRTSLLSRLG